MYRDLHDLVENFMDIDGYHYVSYDKPNAEIEITCTNGECSIELFMRNNKTHEAAAETEDELIDAIQAAVKIARPDLMSLDGSHVLDVEVRRIIQQFDEI